MSEHHPVLTYRWLPWPRKTIRCWFCDLNIKVPFRTQVLREVWHLVAGQECPG